MIGKEISMYKYIRALTAIIISIDYNLYGIDNTYVFFTFNE